MKSLLLFIPLLLASCSYTHEFGQIGPHRLYKVQLGSIAGSTQTMFGILNTNDNSIIWTTPIGGNGLIGAVGSGSGQAAAGWFIGKGLEKGNFSSSVNVNADSAATAQSAANSSSTATIPDPPPAPPIGLGPPFGSKQGWPRNPFHK